MSTTINKKLALCKSAVIGFSAISLSMFALNAQAATNLVLNGNFTNFTSDTTAGHPGGPNGGQLGYNTTAADWSTTGYNFLYTSGVADTYTGVNGSYGANALWGPNNGSANGFNSSAIPGGGNFIAADADFQTGPISQTVNGLTAGNQYSVTFDWAASQQYGFSGATTQGWQVSFGAATQDTAVVTLPNHAFSGWMQQTFTFTADNSSDVLSFLAQGSPQVPPFTLLADVSVVDPSAGAVPEPLNILGVVLGGGLFFGVQNLLKKRKSSEK